MIRTAIEVNTYKIEWAIEKIKIAAFEFVKEKSRKAKATCIGLVFKLDIDDLRESPTFYITKLLVNESMDVLAVEPK